MTKYKQHAANIDANKQLLNGDVFPNVPWQHFIADFFFLLDSHSVDTLEVHTGEVLIVISSCLITEIVLIFSHWVSNILHELM